MTLHKNQVKGAVVTRTYLTKTFGSHAVAVLENLELPAIEEQPHNDGERWKYKLLNDLPTQDEFSAAERAMYTTTVASIVERAFNDFAELKDELQEWHDNLPESFQEGDKGYALSEAVDELERLEPPEIPEVAKGWPVFFRPPLECHSRSARCGVACEMLRLVAQDLEHEAETRNVLGDKDDHKLAKSLKGVAQELFAVADDAESVNFPGMY